MVVHRIEATGQGAVDGDVEDLWPFNLHLRALRILAARRTATAATPNGEASAKAAKPTETARSPTRKAAGRSGAGRAAFRCFGWALVTSGSMSAS